MHTNTTSYEDETIRAVWDDQEGDDQAEREERRAESIRDRQRDDDDR